MDTVKLTTFFKWCTILNVGFLFISAIMILLTADFIYGAHGQMFNVSREAFDTIIYASLTLYKVLILVFNLAPYVALLIIGKYDRRA